MKKNVLALSIATMIGGLGFAGAAAAAPAVDLSVAESGTGHILLVPYYTAQDGNMTVLHVVNTDTSSGKAMKVRFRGASNSDDVLDFQVFMSPGDVWTAAVSKGADGKAQLVTADGSCTLPQIAKQQQIPFVTDRLNPGWSDDVKANNTREGYVEIFNMADIDSSATYTVGGTASRQSALFTAIKHVNGTAPCTDTVLNGTLTTGSATPGLLAPTTGLTGSWYIINVPQTTTFAGAATAIIAVDAIDGRNPGTGLNVFSPQSTGATGLLSADPLFKANVIQKQQYDVPDLSTPYAGAASAEVQATKLTSALEVTSVINQYATDAIISAKTDWVFSMPTRRYSIAANYAAPASAVPSSYADANATAPTGGFANVYRLANEGVTSGFNGAGNTSVNALGQICVNAQGQTFFDREETSKKSGAVFSPGQVSVTQLCGEVSVLSFASGSVLGASVATQSVTGTYENGWGQVNFKSKLPVLGASFQKLSNPKALPGTSGNYGVTWPHAYTK